jgi:S-adenosylmethionine:tRNA ribosyltransferase-isomerase
MTPSTCFSAVAADSSLLAAYDYVLPGSAIAQHPVEPRSAARLLIDVGVGGGAGVDGSAPRHLHVADLPTLLEPGDVLVVNETRVLAARLSLRKAGTGGAAEVFLLEHAGGDRWQALVRPGRRLRAGTVLVSPADGTPVVEVGELVVDGEGERGGGTDAGHGAHDDTEGTHDGRRFVRLLDDPERHGAVPLPPYIHEPLADPSRYQTVYARTPGSVASPTAGLHLTDDVLAELQAKGVEVHAVDLAIGLGTFRPIATERIADHRMHEERYRVPEATMHACARARGAGKRVVAVGTTALRALESAAEGRGLEGRTDLFITPGYEFRAVDVLLTNFHQPRSSLLVLLAAFVGHDRWRRLYANALEHDYRFLSFGDAMLVSRAR